MGCWKAFLEHGLSFGAVAGSSIGALNGALICQGDWDSAYRVWRSLRGLVIPASDLARLRRLALRTAFDLSLFFVPVPNLAAARYLRAAIAAARLGHRRGAIRTIGREGLVNLEELLLTLSPHLDMAKVIAQPTPVFVTASTLRPMSRRPGEPTHFNLQDLEVDSAWKALAASMSVPIACGAVEINGRAYRDGGLTQWLPIAPLYDNGFRRILAVSIKAGHKLDPGDYPGCEVILICPDKPLGRFPLATFRFTERAISAWVDQGYEDATRVLNKILPGS